MVVLYPRIISTDMELAAYLCRSMLDIFYLICSSSQHLIILSTIWHFVVEHTSRFSSHGDDTCQLWDRGL